MIGLSMIVLFGYSADFAKVMSVYWETPGKVTERALRADGTTKDIVHRHEDLRQMMDENNSFYNPLQPAEVQDVRVAFKYLGKPVSLAKLLPNPFDGDQR